jgi:hypothetical protein
MPAGVAFLAKLQWMEWSWGALPVTSPIKGLGAGPGASDLLLRLLPRSAVEAREVGGRAALIFAVLFSRRAVEAGGVGLTAAAPSSVLLQASAVPLGAKVSLLPCSSWLPWGWLCSRWRFSCGIGSSSRSFSLVVHRRCSVVQPGSKAVGQLLRCCIATVRRQPPALCSPSGLSPWTLLQADLGGFINLEAGVDKESDRVLGSGQGSLL